MASIREQLLARCAAALTAAGITNVERSREIPVSRAQSPRVIVSPRSEESERMSFYSEKHQLRVAVEILVRGNPWDQVADPIAAAVYKALVFDAQLVAIGAVEVRKVSTEWTAEDADLTAGVCEMVFQITYLADRSDLSAAAIS